METSKILTILVLTLGLMVCQAGPANAAPMGTAWTYQGRLIDANEAADGLYDFKFSLYDDPCTGTQQGSTIVVDDVDLIDGYFTVELDFGAVYDGEARWLEIIVRPGASIDGNDFVTLSPRQETTPAPYAIYAQMAEDANTIDGLDSSQLAGKFHVHAGEDITSGTIHTSRYSAYYDLSVEGFLNNAPGDLAENNGSLQQTLNADMLDSLHEGAFFRLAQSEAVTGRPAFNGGLSGSISPFTVDSSYLVSLLNADYLDGLHEDSFFRLSQSETVTGVPYLYGGTSGLTPPFYVDSTFKVTNLNADYLDGNDETSFFQLNQNEMVTGIPSLYGGASGFTPPFYVDSTYKVANLNADLLDGFDSSSFLTPSSDYGRSGVSANLYEGNTALSSKYLGISATATNSDRVDGYHAGNLSGNVAVSNGTVCSNLNADRLDGLHASSFASVVHNHDTLYYTESESDSRFVNVTGDTMSASLSVNSSPGDFAVKGIGDFAPTNGYLGVQGATGYEGISSIWWSGREIGVAGISTGASTGDNYGVVGHASQAGVRGEYSGDPNNYGELGKYGGYGLYASGTNHAGYFIGKGFFSDNVGIGTTTPTQRLDVSGNVTASRYYDRNNTSYYVDPASTSVFSSIQTDILYDRNNTSYYVDPASTSVCYSMRASTFYDRDNTSYYVDPANSALSAKFNGRIEATGNIESFGPNGNLNARLSYLTGYLNNGYVAVKDSAGTTQAGMYVDSSGDGRIYADSKSFRVANPDQPGTEIWYTCPEGPEAAAYVRGTGHLTNGKADVPLPDHFAAVASSQGITVQVTPLSAQSKGLAVVEKSADSFVVQELFNGDGTYDFDYTVMAVRKGHEGYQVIRPALENKGAEAGEGGEAGS